jgi:hypothetical protein
LPNGIPSRDCILRLLVVLNPETFLGCFRARIAAAIPIDFNNSGRLVAIDRKTCRGSHDAAKRPGELHVVSAWSSDEGVALGQVATDAKSNEITAIPQRLGQIDRDGTLIIIDRKRCGTTSSLGIPVASGSAMRSAATGGSSRCAGYCL